jgi:hypothetical protein
MTTYSYATSLPPYQESPSIKKRQQDELLAFILKGANNLLQLSQLTGLPQSTVSGRINDLIDESKVLYFGFTIYADRKRKKIVAIKKLPEGKQSELTF